MTRSLLFIDVLGVKSRWLSQGRLGAEAAFTRLGDLAATALSRETTDTVFAAFAESDAFCADVADLDAALRIADTIYRTAFEKDIKDTPKRYWLRGVVVPSDGEPLRSEKTTLTELPTFKRSSYSSALLDAVNFEKSGFRGMRLLVSHDLIDSAARRRHTVSIDGLRIKRLTKLKHSPYPNRTANGFDDYLWFAPHSRDQWNTYDSMMASRLRYAAVDSDEFVQAAATQLLFHEVRAILTTLQKTYGTRNPARS